MARRSAWVVGWLVVALSGLLLAGCEEAYVSARPVVSSPVPAPLISLPTLADNLQMRVDRLDSHSVCLVDERNMVLLYPGHERPAYVNGIHLAWRGDIKATGQSILVAPDLETAIRRVLLPLPPSSASAVVVSSPTRKEPLGVVLLDPGHGGRDPGCVSPDGREEKAITLTVAQELARRLGEAGVTVHHTRQTDAFVSLNERVAHARRLQPDLFISIHVDSCQRPGPRGYTIFVPRRCEENSPSQRLGRAVDGRLAVLNRNGRGVRHHDANLRVLEKTTVPAVLVELGFLSNPTERRKLTSDSYQQRLAAALAEAVQDYLASH